MELLRLIRHPDRVQVTHCLSSGCTLNCIRCTVSCGAPASRPSVKHNRIAHVTFRSTACFARPILSFPRTLSRFSVTNTAKGPLPKIVRLPKRSIHLALRSSLPRPRLPRRTCLAIVLVSLLSPTLPSPAQAKNCPSSTKKAVEGFRKVTALQDLAFEFTDQRKFVQGEYVWTKLISLDDEHNDAAYSNRGNCRTPQGKFDLAIADFNRATELASDEPGSFLGKGVALDGLRNFEDVLTC